MAQRGKGASGKNVPKGTPASRKAQEADRALESLDYPQAEDYMEELTFEGAMIKYSVFCQTMEKPELLAWAPFQHFAKKIAPAYMDGGLSALEDRSTVFCLGCVLGAQVRDLGSIGDF